MDKSYKIKLRKSGEIKKVADAAEEPVIVPVVVVAVAVHIALAVIPLVERDETVQDIFSATAH